MTKIINGTSSVSLEPSSLMERVKQVHTSYLNCLYVTHYFGEASRRQSNYSRHFDFVIGICAALSGGSGLATIKNSNFAWLSGAIGIASSRTSGETAAYALSVSIDPILVGCDGKSTFTTVIEDVVKEVINKKPTIEKNIKEAGAGFSIFKFSGSIKTSTEATTAVSEPSSVNEAVRLIQYICDHTQSKPVIVVDEFDQMRDSREQEAFTDFIKQISDKHLPARFIFCGIGDSVDALMAAHGSADRYFYTVNLGQLPWEARFEIVTLAAEVLGIEIDDDTIERIARISDGFPHYVHFVSEKLFWRVFEAQNEGRVTGELFGLAMSDAAESMEMRLRRPYETATPKYRNDYEYVLWAAVDGHELQRRSTDIFESYSILTNGRLDARLDRQHFNQRLNSLERPSHGEILTGTRQGWYEFTEKMIREYVRLGGTAGRSTRGRSSCRPASAVYRLAYHLMLMEGLQSLGRRAHPSAPGLEPASQSILNHSAIQLIIRLEVYFPAKSYC